MSSHPQCDWSRRLKTTKRRPSTPIHTHTHTHTHTHHFHASQSPPHHKVGREWSLLGPRGGGCLGKQRGGDPGPPCLLCPFLYSLLLSNKSRKYTKKQKTNKKDHKEEEWVMEREAWRAPVHRVRKSRTGLSN